MKLLQILKGKKTLICAALGGLVVALKLAGVVDDSLASTLLELMGFGGLAALRLALAKK